VILSSVHSLYLNDCLLFSAALFALGVGGILLHRKNIIRLLLCVELMLLAVNVNFVAFSTFFTSLSGQIFVFFVLTVAAAETAIGLALLVLLYRHRGNISVEQLNTLKESS